MTIHVLPRPSFTSVLVSLRLLADICPASKWSAAAAPDIQPFVDAAADPLPCVADREAAHTDLVAAGIATADNSFNTYLDIELDEDGNITVKTMKHIKSQTKCWTS